jgi:hypothetical protein
MVSCLVGCSPDGDGKSAATTTTGPTTTTTQPEVHVSVYFQADEEIAPGAARTADAPAVAAGALTELLAGPTEAERAIGRVTAIPEGTRLLGVSLDDSTATVDLSKEFTAGGGSLSMQARLAQVVYTATQFPDIESVRIHIEGAPVRALGGEGVLVEEPVTRAGFEFQGRFDRLVPPILVETPRPFATVGDPVRVAGSANTFEATVHLELLDEAGNVLADEFVTATSGSGTRGTFDATLAVPEGVAGPGTVLAFEISARDGSRTNVVRVPVTIAGS